jgi:hypothetical protein
MRSMMPNKGLYSSACNWGINLDWMIGCTLHHPIKVDPVITKLLSLLCFGVQGLYQECLCGTFDAEV